MKRVMADTPAGGPVLEYDEEWEAGHPDLQFQLVHNPGNIQSAHEQRDLSDGPQTCLQVAGC